MNAKQVLIDKSLVHHVSTQFPEWKNLTITPVEPGGWDNRTFRLGKNMLVRMSSAKRYEYGIQKEQKWLPKLAPHLPLLIPYPIALGKPDLAYPYEWSIYRWIEGETAEKGPISNYANFAISLAQFLIALQNIDSTNGPMAGAHNFYRGGSLRVYDSEMRQAITLLKGKIDKKTVIEIWESALATSWNQSPVWVHGDISPGNLLVKNGQLYAIIDFGGLAIGDPACDLGITWTFFTGESREIFRKTFSFDSETWARGRAWTLWKALIIASGLSQTNNLEGKKCWQIINEILQDHKTMQKM